MTTSSRIILAVTLIFAGLILFFVVASCFEWDFSGLFGANYTEKEYEITESFNNISITTKTADITVLPSEDGKTSVIFYEKNSLTHNVKADGDSLKIELDDQRPWYERILNFPSPSITVYLPEGEYGNLLIKSNTGDVEIKDGFTFSEIDISLNTGDVKCCSSTKGALKIESSTGDVFLEKLTAAAVYISVSTGDISASEINSRGAFTTKVSTGDTSLFNVLCESFYSQGSTGDLELSSLVANGKIEIERSTGDVKLKSCDGSEIYIKTDTGNISGSLLSDKIFITSTNTGKINVPKSTSGGICELHTDTGNIAISVE